MRLIDYLHLVRQRLALVGAVMATVALISVGFNMTRQPIYEASVRLRTLPSAPDALGSSVVDVLASSSLSFTTPGTEALLVQSVEVGQAVARRLRLAVPPEQLIKQVSVTGVPDTTVLVLTVSAVDAVSAIQLANGFAESYLEARRADANEALDRATTRLGERLSDVQARLSDASARVQAAPPGSVEAADVTTQRDLALADLTVVRGQLRDLSDREALEGGFGEIIVPATEAKTVRSTSAERALVFGLLLGAPVALAIVLLLDSLSQTVRTKADAESITGVEVLGLIPVDPATRHLRYRRANGFNANGHANGHGTGAATGSENGHRLRGLVRRNGSNGHGGARLTIDLDPFSLASEAYRATSLNLSSALERARAQTVLITSSITGEGKTTTAANLAVCHAEQGTDVVLVDADLRRPSAHELVGGETEPGLADLVGSHATPRAVLQPLREHLRFVGSGGAVERPDQLIVRADVRHVLARLRAPAPRRGSGNGHANGKAKSPETVVIDSAPVLQAAETLTIARNVDGVVLVLRSGVTRRQTASRTVEQLRRAGANLLGVVLVGVSHDEQLGMGGSYGSGRRELMVVAGEGA